MENMRIMENGKNINKHKYGHDHGGIERQKQGISSFNMQDSKLIFKELGLCAGDVFLDLGCGAGDYAMVAAKIVGDSGIVYALDRWEEVAKALSDKAASQGFRNIRALQSDIVSKLPLEDKTIDTCLIAQVLHGINSPENTRNLVMEISRVLKPGGCLAILEMKKEDFGFGPPMHVRLLPEEVEVILEPYGFKKINVVSFEYSYLIQLKSGQES